MQPPTPGGRVFRSPTEFRCGVYLISFTTPDAVMRFVERFSTCPLWPVIGPVHGRNAVFVIAVEPVAQQHGRFADDGNTLVERPELVGALSVSFRRDDGLLRLFPGHSLATGYAATVPCGSDCSTCPQRDRSCAGCPAFYSYPDSS